jgi:hypothetical protein
MLGNRVDFCARLPTEKLGRAPGPKYGPRTLSRRKRFGRGTLFDLVGLGWGQGYESRWLMTSSFSLRLVRDSEHTWNLRAANVKGSLNLVIGLGDWVEREPGFRLVWVLLLRWDLGSFGHGILDNVMPAELLAVEEHVPWVLAAK